MSGPIFGINHIKSSGIEDSGLLYPFTWWRSEYVKEKDGPVNQNKAVFLVCHFSFCSLTVEQFSRICETVFNFDCVQIQAENSSVNFTSDNWKYFICAPHFDLIK